MSITRSHRQHWKALFIMTLATLASSTASAALTRAPFGTLVSGEKVEAVTLTHGKVQVTVITLGATLQAVKTPDAHGQVADIVLGYDTLAGYADKPNYFGATIGRYANRIGKAQFVLDGKTYQLPQNNGVNSLHGGDKGFDKRNWEITETHQGDTPSVTMRLVSPDGDQGYPGTLTATVTYSLSNSGALIITYGATTDKPTMVNLTNHAYWNLSGEGNPHGALHARLTIPATQYTPVDDGLIPTGEFRAVKNSVFDFTKPMAIDAHLRDGSDAQMVLGRGYDHNWVVADKPSATPRLMAHVEDDHSGRVMDISSTSPGVQFYAGNFLDGTLVGKHGHMYRQGDAFCLEPQLFPDTPNKPAFGSARLNPGEHYTHIIEIVFSVKARVKK
jgi:aldose 1-epimerase